MLTEIFWLFVALAVGAVIGYRISEHIHHQMIQEILKRAGLGSQALENLIGDVRSELPADHEDALPRVEVKIEQHGQQFYAFRKDNDEFLGQSADWDSLLDQVQQKARNNFVAVVRQN